MEGTAGRYADRTAATASLLVGLVGAVLLFLLAVRLLGTATDAASPQLGALLSRLVTGELSALGLGWLATYGLMNGSVVAAVAVSLFDAGVVTAVELFLLVTGSRLGSAAILVLLGALDYVHHRRGSLAESTGLGLLAFLLTISVYAPATVLGYAATASVAPISAGVGPPPGPSPAPFGYLGSATRAVAETIGPFPAVGVAVALLFGSYWLFDRLLARAETGTVRRHVVRRFRRPAAAFGLGLVLTGLTTSVAFSLGVAVPLYNRGVVRREEVVPYVLGANLGTLMDTLLVAVVLESSAGVSVVLAVLASALLVTLGALAVYPWYRDAVSALHDLLVADRRWYAGFLLALVLLPAALVVAG